MGKGEVCVLVERNDQNPNGIDIVSTVDDCSEGPAPTPASSEDFSQDLENEDLMELASFRSAFMTGGFQQKHVASSANNARSLS